MLCSLCQTDNSATTTRCRACGSTLVARGGVGETANVAAPDALPDGALLGGTYAVEGVLGQGGFGITYRCHDRMLDRRVAVKEFFPSGCRRQQDEVRPSRGLSEADYREARTQFLVEARVLARCHHAGIVSVYAAFEANETAYMVMELLHGKTLAQLLSARGGRMNEAEAVGVIERVGEALEFVHELELLHRDIKPDNIIVCDDGRVMLIDFGTAREIIKDAVQGHTVVVTPGYAPLEQYAKQARRGAFTDIYSLAATLYHLLTGQMPPAASDRAMGVQLRPVREENPRVSAGVARAVEAGLQMEIARRPQSVREFLKLMTEAGATNQIGAGAEAPRVQPSVESLPLPETDFSGALEARQRLLDNVMPAANVQPAPLATPVKIAPPRAFPLASNPPKAPVSRNVNVGGGNLIAGTSPHKAGDATTLSWWLFAIIIGGFGLTFLAAPGSNRNTSSRNFTRYQSSQAKPYNYSASPSATNQNKIDLNQEAAERAWNVLPVLQPTSAKALSNDSGTGQKADLPPGGVTFSPDGKRLAYVDKNAVLNVLSLPNRQKVRSLKLDKNYKTWGTTFSTNNQTIAIDQEVVIANEQSQKRITQVEAWSLKTGKKLGTLASPENTYHIVFAVLDDEQLILQERSRENLSATFQAKDIFRWNPKTGQRTPSPLPDFGVASWSYGVLSPDGKEFAVGDAEGRLQWLDWRTKQKKAEWTTKLKNSDYMIQFGASSYSYSSQQADAPLAVRGIDYSLNGQWLASRNAAEITVFDSKADVVKSLTIDGRSAMNFSISPDGTWLAARGNFPFGPMGNLLWNIKTGQKIRLQAPYENLRDFGFSQDGKQLYGIFADAEGLHFVTWEANAKAAQIPRVFTSVDTDSISISGSRANSKVISQSTQLTALAKDSFVEILDRDGYRLSTLDLPNAVVAVFSPDDKFSAVRQSSGAVQLCDVEKGKVVLQLEEPQATSQKTIGSRFTETEKIARTMAFSSDNNLLAYARSDGDAEFIELWDVKGKPQRITSFSQKEPTNVLIFSPDANSLICGGEEGVLRWYDVAKRRLKSQTQSDSSISDIAFAAGNLVTIGESASTLYRVPANSASPLQKAPQTKLPSALNQRKNVVKASVISPDGKLLITAQESYKFQIWELPSGRLLQELPQRKGQSSVKTSALTFAADSNEFTSLGQRFGDDQVFVTTYRRAKAK